MAKGHRKPIPNSTNIRATEKLGRVVVDLSGPKITLSLPGVRYVMLVNDDYSRHAWVYFLKHKSNSGDVFRKFLADARADGVPSKVEIVRSGNGGEFFGGEFGELCTQHCIEQEFTNADSPKQNGLVERALGIIKNARLAACIQVPIIFPHVQLPPTKSLWAEAVQWAWDALNHTRDHCKPGEQVTARNVVRGYLTCFAAPDSSPSVLSLETPVEVTPPGREMILPCPEYRPPK